LPSRRGCVGDVVSPIGLTTISTPMAPRVSQLEIPINPRRRRYWSVARPWRSTAPRSFPRCRRFCHASALRWEDIDEGRAVILVVRKQVRGRVGPVSTKKRAPRELPLAAELAEILRDHRQRLLVEQAPSLDTGWIFPSPRAGKLPGEKVRTRYSDRRGGDGGCSLTARHSLGAVKHQDMLDASCREPHTPLPPGRTVRREPNLVARAA
jgi:integrase